jgi:peptide-methionine (S)-S-oxide reductase
MMMQKTFLSGMLAIFALASCAQQKNKTNQSTKVMNDSTMEKTMDTTHSAGLETATFGTGCFWCTEAIFQQLKGVESATSGYSGGSVANPTYEEVCSKTTGHAEVLQVVFDPKVITFDELLSVFWQTHDPTTLNRQGNDVGPQYRSAIFYHNEAQRLKAEKYKAELDSSGAFENKIVTEITAFKNFYAAEDYHQNYYRLNGNAPYCQFVVRPKVEKFEKVFKDKLKGH